MRFSSLCRWLLATAALLPARPAAAQDSELPHLRELVGIVSYGEVSASLEQAVEERMRLPAGYPQDLEHVMLVHLEVSPTGQVENVCLVSADKGMDAVVLSAALAAVRQLPVLVPGHRGNQPVRTALTLLIRPGVAAVAANRAAEARAAAEADYTEASTLRAGTSQLQPGETTENFLRRTLPASYPGPLHDLLRYAWYPNEAGPQLFFSARGHHDQAEEYDAVLFVLNPVSPAAYNVQAINLGSMGDLTNVLAVFFADANHDGQKDLLALTECSLQEAFVNRGERLMGRKAHYQTTVIYYRGRDAAGRPRYEQQYREDLDEIATAAEVRQALAAPPRRPKSTPKRNPRARTAK